MKKVVWLLLICVCIRSGAQDKLVYHDIVTDDKGVIIPWFNPDPALSFDHTIGLVWNFWDTMRVDFNGLPYYLNHMVWRDGINDSRGIGGDQLQMALSSWRLLYAYSGNERVKQNMKFMADYYLAHASSPADCKWPNLPFPYNTLIYSGTYDGDMILGKGYLQPDKAGSFGLELVHLYKMSCNDFFFQTTSSAYLDAAKKIARTMIAHLQPGDKNNSPLPFKVNAFTGELGKIRGFFPDSVVAPDASYTSNWSATMQLFLELQELDKANAASYRSGFRVLLDWMNKFPLQTNRWGPFFEDVQGWSDTQINAMTFAMFMMEHPVYFPDWKNHVRKILAWVYGTLGNDNWKKYGVVVVNEQTFYKEPGESHTARQGATELLYSALSGDISHKENAIRQLIWSTYAVDLDGKTRYPHDDIWLTDGYGDFIRHYLRAMGAFPELAPSSADHIVSSTSVIQEADYIESHKPPATNSVSDTTKKGRLYYRTYDSAGTEKIRMTRKPASVLLDGKPLTERKDQEGYEWISLDKGGIIVVRRLKGTEVIVN